MNHLTNKGLIRIAESLEEHSVLFTSAVRNGIQEIEARADAGCGPEFSVIFVALDDSNAIGVSIERLFANIPGSRFMDTLAVCNDATARLGYWKIFLDREANINLRYDLLRTTPDEGIGEMAYELIRRAEDFVECTYPLLLRALDVKAMPDQERYSA